MLRSWRIFVRNGSLNLNIKFNNLSIVQWNSNSIRNKRFWLEYKIFQDADIIALQETFLNCTDKFHINNKIIYRNDRNQNWRGGGTLIAINKYIPSTSINLNLPNSDIEFQAVKVFLNKHEVTIVNIYSPKGNFTRPWLDSLSSQISQPFIILGDFNIKNRIFGADHNSQCSNIFIDWLLESNISIINTKIPTHFKFNNRTNLLDYSLCSPDIFPNITFEVESDPCDSDHYPIKIFVDANCNNEVRDKKIIDWNKIDEFFKINNIDTITNFEKFCKDTLTNFSSKVKIENKFRSNWWSSTCAYLLGQKRKHLRLSKKNVSMFHWNEYKKYSAKLRTEIKNSKRKYWDKTCSEEGGSKNIYRILKSLTNRYSNNKNNNLIIEHNGQTFANTKDQINIFCQKFKRNDITDSIQYQIVDDNSFLNSEIGSDELEFAIKKTKNTAPGPDGIPATLLKKIFDAFPNRMLLHYNSIFERGCPPESWKIAKILLFLKPGKSASNVDNFRPISLTPISCKIFERILLNRLVKYCLNSNLFNPNQFGFLPFREAHAACSRFHHEIRKAREKRDHFVCVGLDLAAAYDSVWIEGLLFKLSNLGIGGKIFRIIKSLLSNRKFFLNWRNHSSKSHKLTVGLPQGSVLSPILFMFYLNDIYKVIPKGCDLIIYADDILLFGSDPNFDTLISNLQQALENIENWCKKWKFNIKAEKSSIIDFSGKRNKTTTNLKIFDNRIPQKNSIKFLGVIFSENLTFNQHFLEIKKNV